MTVSPVSAGGIRGVFREEDVSLTNGSRELKADKSSIPRPTVPVTAPIPAQAANPVPAPIPVSVPVRAVGLDLWRSTCNTQGLESCSGSGSIDGCVQCLYAQSLLSSSGDSGVRSCGNFLCNGCVNAAFAFFDCGVKNTNAPPPVTSLPVDLPGSGEFIPIDPVVPVPALPVVPVDNTAAIDEATTSDGCPLLEVQTGSDCTGLIPAPYKFHKCYYRDLVCSCRNDSPFYLCTPRPLVAAEPPDQPDISAPVVPNVPAVPEIDIPSVETFGCSDDLVSGMRCSAVGEQCCVGGTGLCTCGSDLFFVCQATACGIEDPVAVESPVSEEIAVEEPVAEEGVPIPDYVDFSFGRPGCPRSITNCEPCGEFLSEGQFNESCDAFSTIAYEGESLSVEIQCRCFTQDNPNPTWQCRYIEGVENNILPVSPSCNSTSAADPIVDPVAETPIVSLPEPVTDPVVDPVPEIPSAPIEEVPAKPELITEIPPTTECRSVLPTSGVTPCQIPAGEICCHNVQFAIATVCICDSGFFQCSVGVPSDCPDDQNPNVVPLLPNALP